MMKRTKISIIFFLVLVCSMMMSAQTAPFQIAIEPMNISGLTGLQAFGFGQYHDKWLLIGGRIDGLHRRQPWATFDSAGQNTRLLVIDPERQQIWSAPLSTLPAGIQEQLSSTNMEFHQAGDDLYIIGGYGYSITADDHITYPYLTVVKIPDVINAIISGTSFNSYFRQITDELFAVTGGYLNKIYNTYYLTGGQRFDGRYNPMGHPSYVQEYTNSIRRFNIADDGTNLSVTHLVPIVDSINLHRRDYNVVSQIMPNGQEGLTAFSGVFQVAADLPYTNCVNIDSTGYSPNNAFSQFYNHYHCAHIPLYSASANEMHNVFFGGIAQYYDSAGILVQNNNVPFVKTIARVTRNGSGVMAEYKLPVEMPAFLGASSEFIPSSNLPEYNNAVLKLDDFTSDTTLVGYIFGGIHSSAANIFWMNDGSQSSAGSQIFKIYLVKNSKSGIHKLNTQSTGTLHLQVYPDIENKKIDFHFNLESNSEVTLTIGDANGRILQSSVLRNLNPGINSASLNMMNLSEGAYFITIETTCEKAEQKIIIEP
jgi:hypothetical protein